MKQAPLLDTITETIEGYKVKDLRWLPVDNIIVGLVQCPIWGNSKLNDGFISMQWTRRGKMAAKYCNGRRNDLILKMGV